MVVDSFSVDAPKTRQLLDKLKGLEITDAMVVTAEADENLMLASRNLYHVDVRDATELDPVSLVGYEKVLMTTDALKKVEERLS